MGKVMKINFAELGMPVFTGRQRGLDARERLHLDDVTQDDSVEVFIPEDVYAITSSYFLGLFGPSVRQFGIEEFQNVFQFQCPNYLKDKVADWTVRAGRDRGDLFSKA